MPARPQRNAKAAQAEAAEGLTPPTAGRKEYTDEDGRVTRIVAWFGYKLHWLADRRHEVCLAYQTTSAPRREGTPGKLRLGPIQEALQPLCPA